MPHACDRINNTVYHADHDQWWQPESALYLLGTSLNPVRVGYFRKKLLSELNLAPQDGNALEVGCGGGILCEEIARMGFETTGIDPSAPALAFAIKHAQTDGLKIKYEQGTGEALPYRDNSYDVVFCCDVLEHVRDLPQVIAEISRVLKPGGVFCYDTINRTFISRLVAINIAQKWRQWAFMPPDLHVWEMFIKPGELRSLLQKNSLVWQEHRGTTPNVSYAKIFYYLHQRVKGKLTYQELGEKLLLVESNNLQIMYMGYAIKKP